MNVLVEAGRLAAKGYGESKPIAPNDTPEGKEKNRRVEFLITQQDEVKQTIARALAEMGQARTWNLMIDVIAQTGKYAPGTPDLTDPSKFIVQGEKRYWLHVALDRDDGTVLGTQLEEVLD